MPDGICEAGYVLDGSACGSWLDADGNEPQGGTFLGTDEQMIDAGYTCDSSCVQIDHYHRSYEDAAACADITTHYTHSTNCCVSPSPVARQRLAQLVGAAAERVGKTVAAAFARCSVLAGRL